MSLIFTLMILKAHASTVLIQGTQARPLDYKATLKANRDYISPTQDYLNNHPVLANRERLLNLFSEAQKSFLENTDGDAKQKFNSVLALLLNDDWDKSDREIFLQCYLRLAQMESDPGARDRWLGQSLLLGDVSFDSSLYPPPLIVRRAELAKQLPQKNLSKRLLSMGWNQILINGQRCSIHDCESWPTFPSQIRVTVLSDQWLSQSTTIEVADFDQLIPNQIALAEGHCNEARLNVEADKFPNKKVFWALDCEKPDLTASQLNLKPAAPSASAVPELFVTAKPAPFYHSKWFWLGVGTVVAVLVVNSNQKREVKEPSTSYGY